MDNLNLTNGNAMASFKPQVKSWPNAIGQTFPAKVGFKGTVEDKVIAKKSTEFKEEAVAKSFNNKSIDYTGPSCPFKDMALLYVAATEDKELGSSILAMSKDIWKEIATEANFWENLVAHLSTDTDKTREKVAKELAKLDDPLHSKNSKNVLTEVMVLGSGRSIWIPSTVIKEHVRKGKTVPASKRKGYFRKYKVDEETIKKSQKKLGKLKVKVDIDLPASKKITVKGIDAKKFKKSLAAPIEKAINNYLKKDSKKSGNIAALIDKDLGDRLDTLNKNLMTYMEPKATTATENESIMWEHGYGAQLGRYYASGETGAKIDIVNMEINASVSGSIQFSAAEGKAFGNFYYPSKNGTHITMKGGNTVLDLGIFRIQVSLEADGFVGVSLMGSAELGLNYDKNKKKLQISPKAALKKSEKDKQSGASASVKAFAGAEASGKVVGALSWVSPEEHDKAGQKALVARNGSAKSTLQADAAFKELFSAGVGGSAAAGLGGELGFFLAYNSLKGKIDFRISGQLVVGLGLGGEVLGSVGVAQSYELTKFIYHQLNNNNFSYLQFMSRDAFYANIGLVLMVIEGVGDFTSLISSTADNLGLTKLYTDALDHYKERKKAQIKAETMAKNILKSPDILHFSPPEVKGACLYTLSETFYSSREEKQEEAIIKILELCQTKAEYRKVLSRIHPQGVKGSFDEGYKRLIKITDWGEDAQLRKINKKFAFLLNIENYPTNPNRMQPIQSRIQYA